MRTSIEAEQAVLGCILKEGDLAEETSLQVEHFSETKHQIIFNAIRESETVDLITITTKLKDALPEIGGMMYLRELSDVPTTANFKTYEQMVFDSYKLRKTSEKALEYIKNTDEEKLRELQNTIETVQELGVVKEKNKKQVMYDFVDWVYSDHGDLSGVDTGISNLNKMTQGIHERELTILAARPGLGKTAFMLQLAVNIAKKTDAVPIIFSLEMVAQSLLQRMTSCIGNIDGNKLRNPSKFFLDSDYQRFSNAMGIIEKMDFEFSDDTNPNPYTIRAKVKDVQKQYKNRQVVVMIDYLQLINPNGRFNSTNDKVGFVTRELKKMALQLGVPVILLSQLSRGVEQRQDKRPMLSDLRDSGNIEQDADNIWFLYRDGYYEDRNSNDDDLTELIIAKQRNGSCGTVNMMYKKRYNQFFGVEKEVETN